MNKKAQAGIIIALIALGIFVFFAFSSQKAEVTNFIEIEGLYDDEKTRLTPTLAVVEGVPGVKYMKLNINVENKGKNNVIVFIDSFSPESIKSTIPDDKRIAEPNKVLTFTTDFIDVSPFESPEETTEFCFTIKTDSFLSKAEKQGCLDVKIEPETMGTTGEGSQIETITTGNENIENIAINTECTENWQCSAWNTCTNGQQARTCTDLNACGTIINKPITTNLCSSAVCTESWSCTSWSSCTNNQQTRTCTDANACGTTTNKPSTSQSCTTQCTPDWQCSDWSSCTDGRQDRLCTDTNNCGLISGKPATAQSCTTQSLSFSTNAINGDYSKGEIYVIINGLRYERTGTSSLDCFDFRVVLVGNTPEGNAICHQRLQDVTQRIYISRLTSAGSGSIWFTR